MCHTPKLKTPPLKAMMVGRRSFHFGAMIAIFAGPQSPYGPKMDAKCKHGTVGSFSGWNAKKMKVVRCFLLQVTRRSIKTVSKLPTSFFSWWKMCPVMLTMNDMLF